MKIKVNKNKNRIFIKLFFSTTFNFKFMIAKIRLSQKEEERNYKIGVHLCEALVKKI